MRAWQLTFVGLAAFTAVAMLVPLCRRIALARGIADRPGPGKAHTSPTPYLGGVAIACGVSASALFLPRWQAEGAAILGAALLLATLGLVDDLRTVRPSVRLAVEAAAAAVAVAAGARIQLFGDVPDVALSILWIVVITNSFNLLDNMDGAVGSIATDDRRRTRVPRPHRTGRCSSEDSRSSSRRRASASSSTTGRRRRSSWATRGRCSSASCSR